MADTTKRSVEVNANGFLKTCPFDGSKLDEKGAGARRDISHTIVQARCQGNCGAAFECNKNTGKWYYTKDKGNT